MEIWLALLVIFVHDQIDDDYGQWCGFTLFGNNVQEILVLTVYNVNQDYDTGTDTLYQQQKQMYLSKYHINIITEDKNMYIYPKKWFVKDLHTLIENAKSKLQDIILTGDINEDVAENYNELTQLMMDMELIDVHAYKHGFDCEISTYARGS